jgi:alpha-L-fucosidase
MREQYHRQLNELASHYGKIDILWFDGGGVDWLGFNGIAFKGGWKARPKDQHYAGSFTWQDDQAVGNLRKLQPSLILNDRTDAPPTFCRARATRPWATSTTASLGTLHHPYNRSMGLSAERQHQITRRGHSPSGRCRRPRRQPASQRRPAPRRTDRAGTSRASPRSRRLAEPIRPKHLRHPRRSISTGRLRRLNLSRQNNLSPHPPSPGHYTLASSSSGQNLSCSSLTGGSADCNQANDSVEITLNGNTDTIDTIIALTLASPSGRDQADHDSDYREKITETHLSW